MKKLVVFALLSLPAFGAFTNFAGGFQWNVRSDGSDSNGGGFDPTLANLGTDFSKQAAAQITYTDLTIVNCGNFCVASSGNPFTNSLIGNVFQITGTVSGTCNVGFYEVVSVSGANASINFDPRVLNPGTVGSVCNAKLGGALLTVQAAVNPNTNGSTIWVKSGTYSSSAPISPPSNNHSLVYIVGYGSTYGDNGTKPILTTATNSIVIIQNSSGSTSTSGWFLQNLAFTTTAGTKTSAISLNSVPSRLDDSNYIEINDCTFANFNNTIDFSSSQANAFIENSSISGDGGAQSIKFGTATTLSLLNSYISGGADAISIGAVSTNIQTLTMDRTILTGGSGKGINVGTGAPVRLLITSSVINGFTSDGIGVSSGISLANLNKSHYTMISSVVYGNGGFGFNLPLPAASNQTVLTKFAYNAWGANTSGNYTSGVPAGTGDVTLSAAPFTNSASGNFFPNSTAGGGAAIKGVGFPGAYQSPATTTGFLDIGATSGIAGGASGSPAGGAFVQ